MTSVAANRAQADQLYQAFQRQCDEALKQFKEKQTFRPRSAQSRQRDRVGAKDLQAYLERLCAIQHDIDRSGIDQIKVIDPVGAHCRELYIEGDFRATKNCPIELDFKGACFAGKVICRDIEFMRSVAFSEAEFRDAVSFSGARFSAPARFDGAVFSGSTSFISTIFADVASFADAQLQSLAAFNGATFHIDCSFRKAKFSGIADFSEAQFALLETEAEIGVSFEYAEFRALGDFSHTTFHKVTDFGRTKFNEGATFKCATFWNTAKFDTCTFGAQLDLKGCRFYGAPRFHGATLPPVVNLSGTQFHAVSRAARAKTNEKRDALYGKIWPAERWTPEDRDAFATLKRLMSEARFQPYEAMFFEYQLRAQRYAEYFPIDRFGKDRVWRLSELVLFGISAFYDKVSRYGRSPTRALGAFLIWNTAFFSVFHFLQIAGHRIWERQYCVADVCLGFPCGKRVATILSGSTHPASGALQEYPALALTLQNIFTPLALFSDKPLVRVEYLSIFGISLIQALGSLCILTLLILAIRGTFQKSGGSS